MATQVSTTKAELIELIEGYKEARNYGFGTEAVRQLFSALDEIARLPEDK